MLPRPPRPPRAITMRAPGSVSSQICAPLSASNTIVPTGTRTLKSSPPLP
jgi:hypothetical protein